jgi:hypothetical protein
MAELDDDLARRMVALVTTLAGRGVRWAVRVAVVVFVAAAAMYLLGLAALDGSVGDVWPVLGALIGLAAVAAPLLAAWRLHRVQRDASALVADVRTLVGRNAEARRVVIDTVEAGTPTGDRSIVVYQRRDFGDLQRMAVSAEDLPALPSALTAVRSFPGLLLIGVLATMGFAFVGFVFLIALAF